MNDPLSLAGKILVENQDWGPSITALFVDMKGIMPVIDKIDVSNVTEKGFVDDFFMYPYHDGFAIMFKPHPDRTFLSPMDFLDPKEKNDLKREIIFRLRLANPFSYEGRNISLIEVNASKDIMAPSIEMFSDHIMEFDRKITMYYSLFIPKKAERVPLIVWLHGAKEGGKSVWQRLLKHPVSRLIEPHIQELFKGVAILVPQANTFWMDSGDGLYTTDGSSMYKKALSGLIKSVLSDNKNLDTSRVYIGGCSNGGFMTIKMLLSYPDLFAAGFPVCEAYSDRWLSKEEIKILAKFPLWFVQSQDDPVVRPENFCLPTIKRLSEEGAADVHITMTEHIIDESGKYFRNDGTPFQYHGHFAWITALNDWGKDIYKGHSESLFSWMSYQRKK